MQRLSGQPTEREALVFFYCDPKEVGSIKLFYSFHIFYVILIKIYKEIRIGHRKIVLYITIYQYIIFLYCLGGSPLDIFRLYLRLTAEFHCGFQASQPLQQRPNPMQQQASFFLSKTESHCFAKPRTIGMYRIYRDIMGRSWTYHRDIVGV